MTRLLILALIAGSSACACGSSSSDALRSGGPPGDSGRALDGAHPGSGGAPNGGSGSAGRTTGSGGSVNSGGGATPVGGATASGGTLSTLDASADAGTLGDASVEGGQADGAAPPSGTATPGVAYCAGAACNLNGSFCCVGMPPVPTSCLPAITGCAIQLGSATVACDDAADCRNGQECCGIIGGPGTGVGCVDVCDTTLADQFCRKDSECKGGRRCRPIAGRPEYSHCE